MRRSQLKTAIEARDASMEKSVSGGQEIDLFKELKKVNLYPQQVKVKKSDEESKTVIKPQQRMTFLAPIKAISDIQSLNLDLNADQANKYQRFNSLVGPKKSPDINSIPAPTPLPVV
jgi:hypothetical protein